MGSAIYAAAGVFALKADSRTLPGLEKLTRNPVIGLLFGWFVLFCCVPHAAAVSPGFLLKFLYPLAFIVPIIGYFKVDYPASRAVSGTLILCAYNLIHLAFDDALAATPLYAAAGWLSGAFAIWCSGLPWTWRDIARACAKSRRKRTGFAVVFFIFSLIYLSRPGAALL
jgi:hypothetical protein